MPSSVSILLAQPPSYIADTDGLDHGLAHAVDHRHVRPDAKDTIALGARVGWNALQEQRGEHV